ncbi:MAG: tRNA uridine-5-carboxymethylaminomethyl(34) synthesis GTPase MnmE [Sphingomonas bacterium]|uniref:tRNA uridine-5-carboxymethylaminomethyl(34) synthesis GTPase MnmE n=1 Tax=Sphingomonas bacterium TaxID=1895847 RepID=UPI002634D11D|nr:tRNA uridine-5-carboxymethylaminomethyl(34) synthesis GTPase MnmE [Sphingomonas bacterium]MDB5710845.1 tRNA uridine-5-carboxymethylaminomethyl(34) synthesis GTPase MnmE [Sphingomonas bacterium]
MDTIFALSSGAPPAAIALIRISGPAAFAASEALAGPMPAPRNASLRVLRDATGAVLDRALVLAFLGPNSATGEDIVELHVHGGRAVIRAVEAALAAWPGLRAAEPGEFTRRALLSGRIDLTEAEGLGDLLSAETETQRRAAVMLAEGGLRRQAEDWTDRVVSLAAGVEAAIDFSDEDDVPPAHIAMIAGRATAIAAEMGAMLATPPVERLRDGLRVVIAGPPNSGKSTLLNALAEREAAIVSPISGTTRDRIEVPIARDGIAYVFTDTAGLTEASDDPIERIGVERAGEAIRGADILLWLGDDAVPDGAIRLYPRADLPGRAVMPAGCDVAVSAKDGSGLSALWSLIGARAAMLLPPADAVALNQRQRRLIAEARAWLVRAGEERDTLLIAEQLRLAMRALHQLTGRSDVEAMLDALFVKFCIGK